MLKKNLSPPERWIVIGIPALFFIGAFMHFLFDISGENTYVALFAPVNESVWEHLKMVLPLILWWVLYSAFRGKVHTIEPDKWYTAALIALLTALSLVPLLYYFYTSAFGTELVWVDILILLAALAAGQLLALHYYRRGTWALPRWAAALFITLLVTLFMVWTVYPPKLPLFLDTTTGLYGLN